MKAKIKTIVFEIGENSKRKEPKNYVKKLLSQHSCSAVQEILVKQNLSEEQQQDVHTFWTESGHRIREKLRDDIGLEQILQRILPPYTGENLTLYRGENKKRYDNKSIGFCWTPDKEIAQMFASGLNSHTFGGLLLQYTFQEKQIIAGPSAHSRYLGENEYTIAVSSLDFDKIIILESYTHTNIIS